MKLLDKKIIKADEFIAQKLSIKEAQEVLYVKNIRLVDDVPFLFAEYYMNILVLDDIENMIDDATSFSTLYKEKYNLDPIRDSSEIDITSTNYSSKNFLMYKMIYLLLKYQQKQQILKQTKL